MRAVADRPFENRLVFINAWNERTKGNHLQPDLKWGRAYLEAVRKFAGGEAPHRPAMGALLLHNDERLRQDGTNNMHFAHFSSSTASFGSNFIPHI
jgi:hypothetical protein